MKCAEFGKRMDQQNKRDRRKPIDNSLRGQALARAKSDDIPQDPGDPWAWKEQSDGKKTSG